MKVKYKCFCCNLEKYYSFNKKEDVEDSISDYCKECKDKTDFYPVEIVKEDKDG